VVVGTSSSERKRYQRYLQVVDQACRFDTFSLDELKDRCGDERPAFVTRLVHQLEQDGLLARSGPPGKPSFRWSGGRAEFSPARWVEAKFFGGSLSRSPASDRPRERLLARGPADLRLAELLAILIRSGRPGESALQAGEKIAAHFAGQLHKLPQAGRGELRAISPAVQTTAYCQIMAGIELGRRVAEALAGQAGRPQRRISSPEDAIAECRERFSVLASQATQEEFHVLCLNTKHEVIGCHRISIGGLDSGAAHPREVFRPAIKEAAAAVILVHNHPSGDPTPSRQDLAVTDRLEQTGSLLGIDVLDHIVVARNGQLSIRQYRLQGGHSVE